RGSRGAARLPHCERGANEEASERSQATAPVPVEAITPGAILVSTSDRAPRLARPAAVAATLLVLATVATAQGTPARACTTSQLRIRRGANRRGLHGFRSKQGLAARTVPAL